MRRWTAVTVAVLVALGSVACGSDDDGGASSTSVDAAALSAWSGEVEQICADAREEVAGIKTPESSDEFLAWLTVQLDILARQADRIEALEVPSGYEEQVSTFLGDYRDLVALAQDAVELTQEGAIPLAEDRMAQLQEDFAAGQEEAAALRTELGVEGCETDLPLLRQDVDVSATTAP